jgi:membrane-associated phospholipid phosphatase
MAMDVSAAPASLLRLLVAGTLLAPAVQFDEHVQDAIQSWRRPGLEAPMRVASGASRGGLVLAGLLVVALGTGPAGPATARAMVIVLAPVNVAVESLKWSVNRPRPDGDRRRANSSFPSSHAANAAAIAFVVGRRWGRLAPGFWLLSAVVGFSRIYLNRHFLSDVLFGAAIGVGLGWMTLRWLRARGWAWDQKR